MSFSTENPLETLVEKIDAIPSLPQVTDKIVELVNKETTSVSDLENAIRTDPGLSSRILRFGNARYYGHEGKVTSLNRAIQILGFKTVRSIALTYGMDQKFTAPELSSFPRNPFWLYSLSVGIASEIIAREIGYDSEKQGELFSAGHLHAVGKSILDQHLHRDLIRIMQKTKTEDMTMYEAEKDVVGLTHCEIGRAVLEQWGLPEMIVSCAQNYYEPGEDNAREEVIVVHLASVLVKTKGFGFGGDQDISYLNEPLVDQLELSDQQFESIMKKQLPNEVDSVRDLVEAS